VLRARLEKRLRRHDRGIAGPTNAGSSGSSRRCCGGCSAPPTAAPAKPVVTIEGIDSQGLFITYRTAGGLRGARGVNDKRLLNDLHVGDRIEVTLTRERAVSIQPRK
jgi:hypothetical protein